MKLHSLLFCTSVAFFLGTRDVAAQIIERPRPAEWDNLVEGSGS